MDFLSLKLKSLFVSKEKPYPKRTHHIYIYIYIYICVCVTSKCWRMKSAGSNDSHCLLFHLTRATTATKDDRRWSVVKRSHVRSKEDHGEHVLNTCSVNVISASDPERHRQVTNLAALARQPLQMILMCAATSRQRFPEFHDWMYSPRYDIRCPFKT